MLGDGVGWGRKPSKWIKSFRSTLSQLQSPAWPHVTLLGREDEVCIIAGGSPSGTGLSCRGQEGKGLKPSCSLPPPPHPLLEKSAPQASRRALSPGRLEQEASCEVHCSLVRRWPWPPAHWDKHAFVLNRLSFWSLVWELLLVPTSCSNFPPRYFCRMVGELLSGPRGSFWELGKCLGITGVELRAQQMREGCLLGLDKLCEGKDYHGISSIQKGCWKLHAAKSQNPWEKLRDPLI